ncbi:hypothetical protein [Nannocystis radixulma]|uniref:Uncharacterized protein n=1 Tax=Nannocystis radixulma TaxID=2995305 RepID=A0ABT5B8M5_9BACT|nr:hypothetical protein [Nannocystis radixulma]MDC0670466.1 hypothetical protein [Nannocystis radixulma]
MRRLVGIALGLMTACGEAPATSTATDGTGSTAGTGETSTSTTAGETASASTTSGMGEATGTGSTSATGETASGETPTSEVEPTTNEPPVTTGGETTTTGTTSDTTGADDTSTGSTGMAMPPVTRAWWVETLPTQIRVIQEDSEAGLCRGIILESLIEGNGIDSPKYEPVEQPAEWGVRYVFVLDDPELCFDPYFWWDNDPAYAESATGTLTFHEVADTGKPASLDVELTGVYVAGEPWVPGEDLLLAVGVDVEVG